MIAKILLTLSLFAGWLYIFTQSGISKALRFSLYTILGFGLYTVWFPETSTVVANILGIGRGADLIFYTWIAFSFGVLLNVHLKLRQHLNLITRLSRNIAIDNTITGRSRSSNTDAFKTFEEDAAHTMQTVNIKALSINDSVTE
jgi:hypothetical protein